jgi:hypothetical protein
MAPRTAVTLNIYDLVDANEFMARTSTASVGRPVFLALTCVCVGSAGARHLP